MPAGDLLVSTGTVCFKEASVPEFVADRVHCYFAYTPAVEAWGCCNAVGEAVICCQVFVPYDVCLCSLANYRLRYRLGLDNFIHDERRRLLAVSVHADDDARAARLKADAVLLVFELLDCERCPLLVSWALAQDLHVERSSEAAPAAGAFLCILTEPDVVNPKHEAIEVLRHPFGVADKGGHAGSVLFGRADRLRGS